MSTSVLVAYATRYGSTKEVPRQSHRLSAKAGWQWTFSHCGTCCAGRKYTSVRELGAQDESSLATNGP